MNHDTHNNDMNNNSKISYSGIIGWIGTCLILIAYLLKNIDFRYELIIILFNLIGSLSVGYICYLKKTWQAFFLEVSWFGVSLYSLGKNIIYKFES